MRKAVFLDRDGVINRLVLNAETGLFESPHREEDFELYPWSLDALRALLQQGYLLFLISNQPSYAKGKTSMENITAIQARFHGILIQEGIRFSEYYYCYHHPQGTVKELTCECECRKPKPYFIEKAKKDYCLDESLSWLVGDRDSDIFCGERAGLRTILVREPHSIEHQGRSSPTGSAGNLQEAVRIILSS